LALLTLLALLSILCILTILTQTTEAAISTDSLAIDYRAVQNSRSTVGIEVHRTPIAATGIAAGIAGRTFEAVRPRLTGQTIFTSLTGKTICHYIWIIGIRLFRPVGVIRRPMVRITRIGYRGIR
jgi:hypothetical protein